MFIPIVSCEFIALIVSIVPYFFKYLKDERKSISFVFFVNIFFFLIKSVNFFFTICVLKTKKPQSDSPYLNFLFISLD